MCPVCAVAIGTGLGISKALGIDDALTSIWIGGLLLSLSFWTVNFIEKKKYKIFKDLKKGTLYTLSVLIWILMTFIPLFSTKMIGRPLNSIWGIDKIIFGTVVGSIFFLIGVWADIKVRAIKGKQLFNFQKVVFPVSSLIIASIVIYFLTK